jgi:hypothetical protein
LKYLSNIDLNKNELQNARIQNLATFPASPVEGQIFYHTGDKTYYGWKGTSWENLGTTTSFKGANGQTTLSLTDQASAVNYLDIASNILGQYPVISPIGSDSHLGISIRGKNNGVINLADQKANYISVAGAASGGAPSIYATGSDSNIDLELSGAGAGAVHAMILSSAMILNDNRGQALSLSGSASTVNKLDIAGGIAGTGVALSASGSDTNIDLTISGKGTGVVKSDTAAADTSTTQLATTAFVIGQAGANNPTALGTVAPGISKKYSREDHVHPTTGIMTTSHAANPITGFGTEPPAVSTSTSGAAGTATTVSRSDHSHDLGVHAHTGATNGGQIDHGTLTGLTDDDHTQYVKADGTRAFTAAISGVTPTLDAHLTTKGYVDAARAGLSIKDPVRVASTTNVVIATGGLLTVDSIVLVAGDRVLLKNQTTTTENGIYAVAAGAWTRTTDADLSSEVVAGMAVWVNEGTINGDSRWVLTTNGTITLGTTSLTFTKDFQGADIVAGAGLTKSGNQIDAVGTANRITVNADSIDIASTYVGQTSITTLGYITTGTWNGTDIAVSAGGTGASDAVTARTNLGATGKYAVNVGDGTATTITVTHNLNSMDVVISLRETASPYNVVMTDMQIVDANNIKLMFAAAPTSGQYRIVVIG